MLDSNTVHTTNFSMTAIEEAADCGL